MIDRALTLPESAESAIMKRVVLPPFVELGSAQSELSFLRWLEPRGKP